MYLKDTEKEYIFFHEEFWGIVSYYQKSRIITMYIFLLFLKFIATVFNVLIFYNVWSLIATKGLTYIPPIFASVCFIISWRRFPTKMEIKRFLRPRFRAVCLWNVLMNHSTKDSECFLSFWVHGSTVAQERNPLPPHTSARFWISTPNEAHFWL